MQTYLPTTKHGHIKRITYTDMLLMLARDGQDDPKPPRSYRNPHRR